MSKIPMIPGSDESKPPQKHTSPPTKTEPGKGAPVDHKGAIEKMHPEHVHKLVQDAHAGKFGPEAQKTAQSAMQQAPQGPQAPGAPQEGAEPNYAGMFGAGGPQQDNDADDQPVSAGQMFGGR